MSSFDDIVSEADQTQPFTEEEVKEFTSRSSRSPRRGRPRKSQTPPPPEEPRDSSAAEPRSPGQEKKKKAAASATDAIIRRVKAYKECEEFEKQLAGIEVWDGMSLEEAQRAYDLCKEKLAHSFNRTLVKQLFSQTIQWSEVGMVQYLHVHNAKGISKELLEESNMKQFDQELAELAMELDHYYRPGPLVRLVGKVANCISDIMAERRIKEQQEQVPLDVDISSPVKLK